MKKKEIRNARTGPMKFVRLMKKLFILASCVLWPALMVLVALAIGLEGAPRVVYGIAAGIVLILFFVIYGFYAMHVSMGTVLAVDTTDKVVHLTTKRSVFTYDVHRGCVAVVAKHRRFVCTFETQNSRDKFVFYTRAPFSKYSDSQFTEADIRRFYPAFDDLGA